MGTEKACFSCGKEFGKLAIKATIPDLQLAKIPIPDGMTSDHRICTKCFFALQDAIRKTITVNFEGKSYEVKYDPKRVKIYDVLPNPARAELVFGIRNLSSDNDNLYSQEFVFELTIPRGLLDAKTNGKDTSFVASLNRTPISKGKLTKVTEKNQTNNTRTLLIDLTTDTTKLEVFGTHLNQKILKIGVNVELVKFCDKCSKPIPYNFCSECGSSKPKIEKDVPYKTESKKWAGLKKIILAPVILVGISWVMHARGGFCLDYYSIFSHLIRIGNWIINVVESSLNGTVLVEELPQQLWNLLLGVDICK